METQKIIKLPYGGNQVLKQEFGVTDPVVSAALHGKCKSYRALKIRKRAREILKELND